MVRTTIVKQASHLSFAQKLAFIKQETAPIAATHPSTSSVKTELDRPIDEEYEQWKREMDLDAPLHREAYSVIFNPCGVL